MTTELERESTVDIIGAGVTPGSVLQPWVMQMGWKLQSILLSGFRGPDHPRLPHVKAVNRWMRRVSQNNADPSKDYMREDTLPTVEEVEAELEYLPCHFVHHFADSLRVVAIHHPDQHIRLYAQALHEFIAVETFHFLPEDDETFLRRHRDKRAAAEGAR